MASQTPEAIRLREWYKQTNKDGISKGLLKSQRGRLKVKRKVLEYLGGAFCISCSCTDIRALEVNHKNGGGYQDQKKLKASGIKLWYSILNSQRKEDFDVRCRVCNAAHFLQMKYGIRFQIIFKS